MIIITILSIFIFFQEIWATEILRPRGVELSKASFYNPEKDFYCLDGSTTIPFSYVNDDYCDCVDGSDEPGTSACPNALYIPSSLVNDGVCDCCDASEEYKSSAECINTCQELGQAAREEAIKLKEEQIKGFNLKQDMIKEGIRIKKEKGVRLQELQQHKEGLLLSKDEKEAAKIRAEEPEKVALEKYEQIKAEIKAKVDEERKHKERQEAVDAFNSLDVNGDHVLTYQELQLSQAFDTDGNGEVSEEEAKRYFQGEEASMSLDYFIETGWLLIRPLYKMEMALPEATTSMPVAHEDEESFESENPPEDEEDGEEEEEEAIYEEVPKEEEATISDEIKYDEETQYLVDVADAARREFDDVEREIRDATHQIQELEDAVQKDFGLEQEYRVLDGECYDFSDREYIYTLCPFDKAVQKSKSGHGETRLGQWGEWNGKDPDKYFSMKYINGQGCWNGPTRSAEVHLSCGVETTLVSVSEPSRCEYLFLLNTPAACTEPTSQDLPLHFHSEL